MVNKNNAKKTINVMKQAICILLLNSYCPIYMVIINSLKSKMKQPE